MDLEADLEEDAGDFVAVRFCERDFAVDFSFDEDFSVAEAFAFPPDLGFVVDLDSAAAFRLKRLWTFLISSISSSFLNPCHPGTL